LNCTIYMHRAKYIKTKLQMFKLETSKDVAAPFEIGLRLTNEMFP